MNELFKNTWSELDNGVRIFLLAGNEKALVIDTGMTGLNISALVSAHTSLPYTLLNTHADKDHTGGNGQFETFYMHPSEAAFYYNIQNGKGKMIPVFDGDTIDLGGRVLEIIHLPGHTPGSITVLDRQNRCLIGGDPIQKDGNIFMFGQQRNMEAYIASLNRLLSRDDFDYIYPSHAEEKVSRDVIPQLIEGAERILSGTVSAYQKEVFGKMIRIYDVGICRFLCE